MNYMEAHAQALGVKRAEREIEAGCESFQDSPLSGEWVDEITPSDLVGQVGGDKVEDPSGDVFTGICNAYEGGYFGTWQEHLDAAVTVA